jgi:hypothetical protein
MFLMNNNSFKFNIIKNYIVDLCLDLLKNFNDENVDIQDINIEGDRHKYSFSCKKNGELRIIPLMFIINDYNNYTLILNNIDNNNIKIVADMEMGDNSVAINWHNSDNSLKGFSTYNVRNYLDKYVTEKSTIYKGKPVYSDNGDKEASLDEAEVINFYLDNSSLDKIPNIKKTVDQNYILYDIKYSDNKNSNNNNNDNSNLFKSNSYQVMIDESIVNIRVYNKVGLAKYENRLLVSLDEKRIDITYRVMSYNDVYDYILVQRHYLDGVNTSGDYKTNYAGRFFYEILLVNKGTKLDKPFEIINKLTLDKGIEQLDDITSYIKRKCK